MGRDWCGRNLLSNKRLRISAFGLGLSNCHRDRLKDCGFGTFGFRCPDSGTQTFRFELWPIDWRTMAMEPFETAEANDWPTVRQQSVFIENRVGQLLGLTRLFEQTDIRILAVSVVYSVDCAICRMIVDDPDLASEVLRASRFQVSEAELIVVSLPHGKRALLHTWAALLGGEINIHYTYPLLVHPKGSAALAVVTDDIAGAVKLLREKNFELLDQSALMDDRMD